MKKILIIGKSGLIGERISQIITERSLPYTIYAGSRRNSNESYHYQIDVNKKETLTKFRGENIDLVVLCTNDHKNNILTFCIENGINYLDITKPTLDLQSAYKIAEENNIKSKIVFASGWMGGIGGALIPNNINIESLTFYIYYSLQDLSGKSSVDFFAENITFPFHFYKNNKPKFVRYFGDPEKHDFNFNIGTKTVYNFDVPDLFILNRFKDIPTIYSKITYNYSTFTMRFMRVCLSLGIFSVLSNKTKKRIFRSAGKGDKTSFDMIYKLPKGNKQQVSIECIKGQAELTSYATVLNIEKLFTKESGIYFAHEMYENLELQKLLEQNKYITIRKNI